MCERRMGRELKGSRLRGKEEERGIVLEEIAHSLPNAVFARST